MTTTGTSYFVSRAAAVRYYGDYGYDDVEEAVRLKLEEGQIHIGPPPLKQYEVAVVIDNGTRYAIKDAAWPERRSR